MNDEMSYQAYNLTTDGAGPWPAGFSKATQLLNACDMPLKRSINVTSIVDWSVVPLLSFEVKLITVRYF
jgi:hypothetical protein